MPHLQNYDDALILGANWSFDQDFGQNVVRLPQFLHHVRHYVNHVRSSRKYELHPLLERVRGVLPINSDDHRCFARKL